MCPFCEIASGRRRADLVRGYDHFVVFRPMNRSEGKLLVAPRDHVESLEQLSDDALRQWLPVLSHVARLLAADSYRVQINVGAVQQNVRHIYAQFTFQGGDLCRLESC